MKSLQHKIVVGAQALEGKFSQQDLLDLSAMETQFTAAMPAFQAYHHDGGTTARQDLVAIFDSLGKAMREVVDRETGRILVYSFQQPRESHGEASRLIAKLRDVRTQHEEFVYYIQRAYELLFNMAFSTSQDAHKHHIIVKTPVEFPVQNYAVHKLPDIDEQLRDCVMCVLLRGALLPSMIMSKEIQEYSTNQYVTPFALFRIKRNDSRNRSDMEYIMDLDASYFDPAGLHGKDLVFADPMNATGGSLVTVIEYLKSIGVKPRSVNCFNVISALKGALQIIRSVENARVFTLWMDPVLNEKAYIMPGLGDAGDRLNGRDTEEFPRNMIQLIADYGSNIANLYRAQVRKIEQTVLGHV
jgi:uracil phosphoribosyltransferase